MNVFFVNLSLDYVLYYFYFENALRTRENLKNR